MEEHLSYTDLLNRVATEAAVNKTRYLWKSTDTSIFLSESQSGNANWCILALDFGFEIIDRVRQASVALSSTFGLAISPK
jgi:hypothetical protein